ncbi:triacylglycerol lipase OBL1-like [Rosa rugosa]|uniref:triacylglycerol lipase OBL1-like n=1 Tax=Rosa rugosa TaxID=74645 RepID=UPI002B414CCB|nr:triacylglycerol lipase OBL1-like [Rosa rugosa]
MLQMILLWIAKRMRNFGLVFEWFLNLPSSKRNWLELSLDLLTGDIKKEKDSASFISTVGHTDKRVKLDSSISRLDVRYRRALSAMAAKIAYENQAFIETTVKNHWKVKYMYDVRAEKQYKLMSLYPVEIHKFEH